MAYAQELKNLVAEIKTGHRDRATRISEIKGETRDILAEADAYIKKVAVELKDAAKALKDFLAKSEETRKKDFNAVMGGIQTKIKDIKGDVKDFIAKSEEKRIVDFKALMRGVTGAVEEVKGTTKRMLADYRAERKEAAGYWGRLGARGEAASATEETSVAPKRRGRRKK